MSAMLEIAERIARKAHAGQLEESTGDDYIKHVERVVAMVNGDEAKAVAWLHGVLEDSDLSCLDFISADVPGKIIVAVVCLTRTGAVNYVEYIEQIINSGNALATEVKIADLLDHLRPNCPARLRQFYEWALGRMSPMHLAASFSQMSEQRTKGIYIGAPACFALEMACQSIRDAFGEYGLYVVGSCLDRPNWRDVDLRYIMKDENFAALFPDAGQHWELDPRWLLMTVSISEHLSRVTGLPIDFQFQPQTHANERHHGRRSAIGIRIAGTP